MSDSNYNHFFNKDLAGAIKKMELVFTAEGTKADEASERLIAEAQTTQLDRIETTLSDLERRLARLELGFAGTILKNSLES